VIFAIIPNYLHLFNHECIEG